MLCGAVTLGERAHVLHGAILTAEDGEIWIGDDAVIMENALVRGRSRHPVAVGNAVLIGPHAHVNGSTVEDEVFIATGASLFPGSVAGTGSELRINSVLHVNSKLSPATIVPIGWIAAGDPAQLFSPDQHEALWRVQADLDFLALSTVCREVRRCARSWLDKPSSTARIETTRSLIVNGAVGSQPHWRSSKDLSAARSFRFARRMATAITGAVTPAKPDGVPRLRRVIWVR